MATRRDSRTEDDIRKQIHEMNSTQTNCDIETLTGLRLRTTTPVIEEDEQIQSDVLDQLAEDLLSDARNDMYVETLEDLIHTSEERDKLIQTLSNPNWSLAPLWFMVYVLVYLYGVTLGLYMCHK